MLGESLAHPVDMATRESGIGVADPKAVEAVAEEPDPRANPRLLGPSLQHHHRLTITSSHHRRRPVGWHSGKPAALDGRIGPDRPVRAPGERQLVEEAGTGWIAIQRGGET